MGKLNKTRQERQEKMNKELTTVMKPCPFCGARFVPDHPDGEIKHDDKCMFEWRWLGLTTPEDIEQWNRRFTTISVSGAACPRTLHALVGHPHPDRSANNTGRRNTDEQEDIDTLEQPDGNH